MDNASKHTGAAARQDAQPTQKAPAHTIRPGDQVWLTGAWQTVYRVKTRPGGWVRFDGPDVEVPTMALLAVRRRASLRRQP